MTAPKYALTYFDFRGRAEVHRLLFAVAGQEFEDKRVSLADWRACKSNYTFEQLPMLEVTENDDKTTHHIAQSHAITRFLAQRFNLAGRNDIERAQCDMINEAIVDMFNVYLGIYKEQNRDELVKKLDEASRGEIADRLARIQKLLEENKDGDGFLVGNSLSYADVQLVNFYDLLRDKRDEVLDRLPLLKAHNHKIRSIPAIAEHIARNEHVHLSILFAK